MKYRVVLRVTLGRLILVKVVWAIGSKVAGFLGNLFQDPLFFPCVPVQIFLLVKSIFWNFLNTTLP